jgi:hypothetical protein
MIILKTRVPELNKVHLKRPPPLSIKHSIHDIDCKKFVRIFVNTILYSGIHKTSYDNFTIVLKAWVPQLKKVNFNLPCTILIRHQIHNIERKKFIRTFVNSDSWAVFTKLLTNLLRSIFG